MREDLEGVVFPCIITVPQSCVHQHLQHSLHGSANSPVTTTPPLLFSIPPRVFFIPPFLPGVPHLFRCQRNGRKVNWKTDVCDLCKQIDVAAVKDRLKEVANLIIPDDEHLPCSQRP
eukprot:749586-Hanusia_phi.AAC.7